jgi:hypothetical protein
MITNEKSTEYQIRMHYLEASWAPIHELDASLRLDRSDSGVHVFRDNVTTVQHATRHVLSWNAKISIDSLDRSPIQE